MPADPESLGTEFGGAERGGIAHLRCGEFLVQPLQGQDNQRAEALFNGLLERRVDDLLAALGKTGLKSVAREDNRDPGGGVAEVGRDLVLRDPGILHDQVDHRVVRVADAANVRLLGGRAGTLC